MQARAHLKLIVSEAPVEEPAELFPNRVSMVLPLSGARRRAQRLRTYSSELTLWSAAVLLLAVAALVALGWL